MSTTVTFAQTGGGTTIVVTGPQREQPVEPVERFVTALTAGGSRYVYRVSNATKKQWRLTFDLTSAEKSSLESFYDSVAVGPTNVFDYTHTDGTTYQARFLDTSLRFVRLGPNEWATTITLEVESAVS